LIAQDVRHRYRADQRLILDGVELSVDGGESVAITGPSGSGKTTLLALLGGLLTVQEGEIHVEVGPGVTQPTGPWIAWVPQTVNVLGNRSAIDNVCLGAFSSGHGRDRALVDARAWLARVGLADRSDDPVRILSGGEVQRVVIARALASGRPLVLADEPTGQLDARTTDSVLTTLLDRSHGRSVVIVTHDPDVARRCDRTLNLRDGRLTELPGSRRPAEPGLVAG
jgi:putative ABC transport system ATP-binding protein/lipoprotein-releasing system ATP-binding protein